MGTRTSYPPGTFCWVDLSTSDREGAKRFYGGLLGWDFDERPGAGGAFSMGLVGDDAVAAIVDQAAREVEAAPGRTGTTTSASRMPRRRRRPRESSAPPSLARPSSPTGRGGSPSSTTRSEPRSVSGSRASTSGRPGSTSPAA